METSAHRMSSSEASFHADPRDHPSEPAAPTAAERRGLALALVAAIAIHLIIPLALIVYYALWPPAAPIAQEIPVEVVIEQPPPPPKQEKTEEKQKPPPPPEDERPAYDAPRAATKENVNRNAHDVKTEAPSAQAEPPLNPGAPQKSESPAPPKRERPSVAPPLDLQSAPEGDLAAAPAEKPSDSEAPPAAETPAPKAAEKPAPEPPAEAPVGAPMPTIDVLPQYKFAEAAKEAPVAGGSAESRYFTIIYGMIKAHMREPSDPRPAPPSREGAIVFGIDEAGNLLGRKLMNSSGSPSLDMAVMAAIAEAAPFPAPPGWVAKYLRLSYGGGRSPHREPHG
jgi:protein TonB